VVPPTTTYPVAALFGLIRDRISDTSIKQSMIRPRARISAFRRCVVLTSGSLFLLFLSLSQPHRVHHLFEGLGHVHDTTQVDTDNHNHGENPAKPAQTDCAIQSVAQNCHAGQAESVEFYHFVPLHESFDLPIAPLIDPLIFESLLQRAPPINVL
jgi:hypothetical protein